MDGRVDVPFEWILWEKEKKHAYSLVSAEQHFQRELCTWIFVYILLCVHFLSSSVSFACTLLSGWPNDREICDSRLLQAFDLFIFLRQSQQTHHRIWCHACTANLPAHKSDWCFLFVTQTTNQPLNKAQQVATLHPIGCRKLTKLSFKPNLAQVAVWNDRYIILGGFVERNKWQSCLI